jgi:hypothetical protein
VIERLKAQNGESILKQRGRLLASRFDPTREAEAWINKRRGFLDKVKGVFVLGLGGGHHVRTLLKATPARVVVIERHMEIVEAVNEDFGRRVNIECIASARELRSSSVVRELIQQSFVVLMHPASQAQEPEFYKDCAAQLIGRDWGALTWQWNLRDLPALEETPRLRQGQAPLTIYDLEQTELVQNSSERERLLIKALRELVK